MKVLYFKFISEITVDCHSLKPRCKIVNNSNLTHRIHPFFSSLSQKHVDTPAVSLKDEKEGLWTVKCCKNIDQLGSKCVCECVC